MIAAPGSRVRMDSSARPQVRGLWTIVLAAGGARRFGRNKLLLRVGPDSLLALAVARANWLTGSRCVVILGADATLLRRQLAGRATTVVMNRRWRDGMAGSLQAGIGALPASASAALITLADQYAIGRHDLGQLATVWARDPGSAVAARVEGQAAAPAILPRSYFPRVMELAGDRGARSLLRQPGRAATVLELPMAALDLDEPGDLSRFREMRRELRDSRSRPLAKPSQPVYIQ